MIDYPKATATMLGHVQALEGICRRMEPGPRREAVQARYGEAQGHLSDLVREAREAAKNEEI